VAKPKVGGPKKDEGFSHEKFVYRKELDCYVCPCEQVLVFKGVYKRCGVLYRRYEDVVACGVCLKRVQCTKLAFRMVFRSPYQSVLDGVDERTRGGVVLYRRRSGIVEHPFGVVKAVWGFKAFLCRGFVKVVGEVSLAFLAYNFRWVFNIFAGDRVGLVAKFG